MSIYSVPIGLLHDSILRFVALFSEKVTTESVEWSDWSMLLYWSLFVGCIGLSLYCAATDIRYIRAQYRIEKRAILKRTIDDKAFRESLNLGAKNKD